MDWATMIATAIARYGLTSLLLVCCCIKQPCDWRAPRLLGGADYKMEKKLKLPRAWLKVERGHIETDNTVCDLTR
jgi:hypothetical protein